MSERGARRGAGAPFYAPLRRKTSAEIISEARAAINGEMSSTSGAGGVSGALRPLRTRRPFTPREPQRNLFTDRAHKRDPRPPSAFDLKHLSVSESSEEASVTAMGPQIDILDEESLNAILTETHNNARKKPMLGNQPRSVQEQSGDGWGGFTKLPHLSGHSKPLHRRYTTNQSTGAELRTETDLAQAISITRPLGGAGEASGFSTENHMSKSLSPDTESRRKQFVGTKSSSYDAGGGTLGNVAVKHLAVQPPSTSNEQPCESLTLLELSEALSKRNRDSNRTVLLMEALQNILEKSVPANSLRDLVLRSLYTHIDSEDERILVAIARALLTMRVTGTHLAAACKLVFKIARNDKNDHFFRNTNLLELLVEGCGRADPVRESECCVYGAGALRVLALEPALGARALAAGATHLAALHLKILNNAKAENPRSMSDHCTHALYQLTGALRNLASAGEREFVASGALAELVAALNHHTDRDVLTNVARCLSVLSAEEYCCAWLCASGGAARALVRALAACAPRPPLAVRLAYTLGNMAAADQRARTDIYNEEGSVDVLLTILESYTKRNDHEVRDSDTDPDLHLVGNDLGGSDGSNEDVLIKTVRVIANLCLAERAGRGLAANYAKRTVNALLACLELADKTNMDADMKEVQRCIARARRRDELATAALATLNNLTFYRGPADPLDDTLDDICKATCRWLRGDGATSCEAVRALGNLSRATRVAQLIVLEGVLDSLAPFLEHADGSVRCAAAGVLVNVCGAGVECGRAAEVCARALAWAAAARDAPAAALLARALWNAHAHTHAHAHAPLSATHALQAADALNLFIDDDSVFAACEASRPSERRASDPALLKHVKFDVDNFADSNDFYKSRAFSRAVSVDQHLQLDEGNDVHSGDDLGFEDGDMEGEECECGPCRRLTAWEELVGVAIPLLEKLRPARADASVGTD